MAVGHRSKANSSDKDNREAVFYVRVSSKEQEEGFSIPAQIEAAKSYASANGLRIVGEFVDIESAKRSGRRQFQEMCRFLKKSKSCRIAIVEKTDRLYRNLKDWVALDELMQERDIAIHLYKEATVLSRDSRSHEKFIHGIKVLMAKNFIDNLSEEVRKGMTEKARQGHYPGMAPVGYVNNPVTKRLDIDPLRAPLVRRLFELYATGEYSVIDLRKTAVEIGLTSNTKKPQPLAKSGINRLLKNPLYHGEFVWKGQRFEGRHTPIIGKALYDRVQAIMDGRDGGVYQAREFAFTGMLTCGHCGCALTAQIQKGKYIYYHCTGNRGKCPEKYLREERIDEQLGEIVRAIKLDDRVFETLKIALKESHADEQAFLKQSLASLHGQETKLVNRLQKLYLDKLDEVISGETYQLLKKQTEDELEQVRKKIDANKQADTRYLEYGIRLLELAQTAYESYSRRSPAEKRKLLNFVCSNCTLKDGKLTPTYRQPFALLASTVSMLKKREAPDLSDQELLEIRGG